MIVTFQAQVEVTTDLEQKQFILLYLNSLLKDLESNISDFGEARSEMYLEQEVWRP